MEKNTQNKSDGSAFPKIILIDNYNACNLSCSICDHKNMTRVKKHMGWDLYKKVIDEIAQKSPSSRVWQIFFGDPFLCTDMPERIKYAKDMGLTDVVLNTNGAAMTKERAKKYIDAGLDWIYVGVDAFTEETYNKIRIGGKFNKVIKNVLDWQSIKSNIFVQFVECDLNRNEKQDFIKFWNEKGIQVKIRPMVSWIGLVDNGNDKPKQKIDVCYWFRNSFNILNTGDVALCACDIHGRYIQGEVRTKSIEEVWTRYQQTDPEACKTCKDWESASAKYYTG